MHYLILPISTSSFIFFTIFLERISCFSTNYNIYSYHTKRNSIQPSFIHQTQKNKCTSVSKHINYLFNVNRDRTTLAGHAAAVAASDRHSSSNFHDRMRNIVVAPQKKKRKASIARPNNVYTAENLKEFKALVADEKESIVVVRFYATWCKACQAIAAPFHRLARHHKNIKFVEVPVTENNAALHQGLSVPSLPFGHIYHPYGGLVEERKISKKYFGDFEHLLQCYVDGSCSLSMEEEGSIPYLKDDGR